MAFFEGLIIKIFMGLIDKMMSFVSSRAKTSKHHNDDQKEFRQQAMRVELASKLINKALGDHKRITKELADELNERNRKLRTGGFS